MTQLCRPPAERKAVDQDNPNGLTVPYGRTITFNRERAFGER
jgi:hypothetical protein